MQTYHAIYMETSCGFVLVNYDSILLLQYPQGHWSFPKGHIEDDDEDHHSTALRELIEETGIKEIIIDENWNFRTEYTFKRKGKEIPKQVFWFLAETDEHTNYLWLNFEDCEKQLTFSQEKILLQSARDYRDKIKK